jgi:hypothetical protein
LQHEADTRQDRALDPLERFVYATLPIFRGMAAARRTTLLKPA